MRRRQLLPALLLGLVAALGGCALLAPADPLQVMVAGVDPLPGEGLELRLLMRLRIQNPNDAPVEYDGVYLQLDVQGKTFATGVSDRGGTIPAFGESVIAVPVTVSALRMARQVMGVLDGQPVDRIRFDMRGKLGRGAVGAVRFRSQGELNLPAAGAD